MTLPDWDGNLFGRWSLQSERVSARSYKRSLCTIDETQLISGTPLPAAARNTRRAGLLSSMISTGLLPARAGNRTYHYNCQNISEPQARSDRSQLLEAVRAWRAVRAGGASSAVDRFGSQTWPPQSSLKPLVWAVPNFQSQAQASPKHRGTVHSGWNLYFGVLAALGVSSCSPLTRAGISLPGISPHLQWGSASCGEGDTPCTSICGTWWEGRQDPAPKERGLQPGQDQGGLLASQGEAEESWLKGGENERASSKRVRKSLERRRQLQTALWGERQLSGGRQRENSGLGEACPVLREAEGKRGS